MIDRTIAPQVHDVQFMPMPQVKRQRLANGIELVTLDSRDIDEVTRITMSWQGGSLDADVAPAAEIAAQLVKTGSRKLDADAVADLLDYNGAWLNAELIGHNNSLTLFSLNRTLDTLLAAMVDMINEPLYPANEFSTIRDKVAATRATALERVTTHADALDHRLAFGPGHPMSRQYTPEEINDITLEMAISASKKLKGRQAPVVFVVGHLTPHVLKTLEHHLLRLECDADNHGIVNVIPAVTAPSTTLHDEMPHALQSAIRVTSPTINRSHPEYEDVRLMTTALGGYFGSRLMTSIREEKGLTYGINAGVYGHREGAFITINSQCDNRYARQVITEIEHEIEKLATVPMCNDELTAVKQTATGSLLAMLDTPFSIMDYYIVQRHMLTPDDYFARQQNAIARLTPESIRDTARRYLVDKVRLISTAGATC